MLHDRFAQLFVGICMGATLTAFAVIPESLRASVLHQGATTPGIHSSVPEVSGSEIDSILERRRGEIRRILNQFRVPQLENPEDKSTWPAL